MRHHSLVVILSVVFASSGFAETIGGMQIVGFEDTLTLQAGDQFVQLTPGSLGYSVPEGVKVTILSGNAIFYAGSTAVRAGQGDSFSYLQTAGQAQILVLNGLVEVTPAGLPAVSVASGQFVALTGATAGQLPVKEPVAQAPVPADVPAAAQKPAEEAPEAVSEPDAASSGDPLQMIGDAFHKLAQVRPKELKLIIELHPFYKLSESYDSNIYLVPKDKPDGTTVGGGVLGSWITKNTFGSKIALPINPRHRLDALYNINLTHYTQQPSINNSLDHHLRSDYEYIRRQSETIKLYEDYLNTEDPAFSELVGRQRRYHNSMGFTYANSRSRRFVYGLDGKLDHHKYLNDTLGFLLNRFEARLGGYAGVKLASKTDLRLGYHREFIHYSAGRTLHSKSHKFDLGVHGQLAPKVTGRVGAGIQLRRYAEPTAGQPDNITTLLTDIGVTYKPFLRTQIGLKLFRNTVETTFSTSRYYEATGASLDYIQRFQKLTLTTNFQFETDRYPETTTLSGITANRRDDIYSGGLILKYDFKKWLSASLNYKRRQRHSTFFGEFDYVSDISGMDMSVAF